MLSPESYSHLVDAALREDIGHGDITTTACVDEHQSAVARLVAKEDLVLAGMQVALECFFNLDDEVEILKVREEGSRVKAGQDLLVLEGKARALLMAERSALNFLQRLCGIATLSRAFADAVKKSNTRVVDTRKTTPGWRELEKYAVRIGGAANHRFGLDDGVLIKENHIAAAGGVTKAIEACRREAHHLLKIEIEVTNLKQLNEALKAKADVIMLDNMTPAQVAEAVKVAKGLAILEASGNMRLDTVAAYAQTGVDLLSVGALTHSAKASDISMYLE